MIQTEQLPVETRKSSPRRRRLRMAIVAIIAAALALALATYRLSRLNDAEKQIVGEWTYPGRPVTQHVRFRADRTFLLWSSDGATENGTWSGSGKDLTIFFNREDSVLSRFLLSLSYLTNRAQNSRNWAPSETRLILDEISPTEMHLRTADGTKAVYQRSGSAND